MASQDFLSLYLAYTDKTECPVIHSRWAAIAGIGALLGRRTHIQHGHFNIYPNIYCMLIGTSGSRKSTTINIQKNLLKDIGYNTIAADKTTKEKFLIDMAEGGLGASGKDAAEAFLWQNVDGSASSQLSDTEILIAADEFNNFLGEGNLDFLSLLGVLWDYNGVYESRIKTGKSISVPNPTVSLLAGNTPTSFHRAFPPEALGQGFFSRLLLIYGERRDRRYPFPEKPDSVLTKELRNRLSSIRTSSSGAVKISTSGTRLLSKIYLTDRRIDDVRFDSYNTRRFTHLLKLCLIISQADIEPSTEISELHVVCANTILTHAELHMSKALGEFGRSKNSDVSHKIVQLLSTSHHVMGIKDIWKHVAQDLEKMSYLVDILQNLANADKIQTVQGKGFLAKKNILKELDDGTVDFSLLTDEEREMPL
jgi:hypothetical protein